MAAFWTAYVLTRPLGASFTDWLGKPAADGGVGLGMGAVTAVATALIIVLVAYLAVTRRDIQLAGSPVRTESELEVGQLRG